MLGRRVIRPSKPGNQRITLHCRLLDFKRLLCYHIYSVLKRRLLLDLQKYGGYSMAFLSLCIFCLLYAMMDQDGSPEQKPQK